VENKLIPNIYNRFIGFCKTVDTRDEIKPAMSIITTSTKTVKTVITFVVVQYSHG
jgi:hypothetical protein